MKNRFTIPKVKHYPLESTKDWYVWFRFNGGNPIRIKTGLNKIQDYNERLEEATALAEVLKEKLEKGWIPNAANIYKSSIEKLTLYSALDFALEKKKSQLAHKSFLDYKCTCRFVKVYAKKMKFDRMYVNSCERFHIKKIFDKLQLDRSWTAKNYNKHLGYIKSLFSELVEWELISSNPVRDIRTQKEEKTESNIPLTDEEHKIVFDFLKERNYNFYVYCSFIYHCGIRPYELTQIKCKYINLEENLIFLPAEITKNDSDGFVPILGNLKDLISGFNFSNPEYYLFGTWVPNGGRHCQKNRFCPNPYKIKRDTATKLWNTLVKKELGINKNMYSLKHKGANDKINAGMDLKTVKEIFRHSDEKITEIYAKSVRMKRFEEATKLQLPTY